jgi:hypothetical protein
MARLLQPPPFTGTYYGLCVYKLRGQFYVRTKSSLESERVKTAPEFEKTRMYASLLGKASKIGSQVYRTLTENEKKKYSSQFLTGKAMKMLKAGIGESLIVDMLQREYFL